MAAIYIEFSKKAVASATKNPCQAMVGLAGVYQFNWQFAYRKIGMTCSASDLSSVKDGLLLLRA